MASRIRTARLRARLTQADVGTGMNRSRMWICMAEQGRVPVSPELERRILTTIARLAAFKETLRTTKAKLLEDLQLPRAGSSIR